MNNNVFYDPHNEIRCDRFALEKLVKESEAKDQRIAELEAKLAESDENIKLLEQDRVVICNTMDMYREKVEELKQQLAEKEDFIEDLMTGRVKPVIPRIKEIEKQYQDKISFALEQLELARRRIDCIRYNENKCLNKKDCVEDCLDEIDNQIEELKKEMK